MGAVQDVAVGAVLHVAVRVVLDVEVVVGAERRLSRGEHRGRRLRGRWCGCQHWRWTERR